jgi:succinate-acetate transporter protein
MTSHLSPRLSLRPLGSPLPLGFAGLTIASLLVTALDLGWVPTSQSHALGVLLLVSAVPLQLLACVWCFPARDGAAATSMGVLAVTWAATGLIRIESVPGATSQPLGLLLLAGGAVIVASAIAQLAGGKALTGLLIAIAGARTLASGLYELTASAGWQNAAGGIGIGVMAVALYMVTALQLEDARHRPLLPTFRRGPAHRAMTVDPVDGAETEPGVRGQL